MRLDDEALDRLAAEYVLGTLPPRVRARLERMAREERRALEAIWRWERQLNVQIESIPPEPPPASVWSTIESRIVPPATATSGGRWFWPSVSGILAFMLVVAVSLPLVMVEQPEHSSLAVFENEQDQPLWVVSVDMTTGKLRTRAVSTPARDLDRVFELWMLVDGAPKSLGLLPVADGNRSETDLSPALIAMIQRASGLAISIEPLGGSPTGQPTGPVVYQAPVLEL